MPLIPFPNVPDVAGVPPIPRINTELTNTQVIAGIYLPQIETALWNLVAVQLLWGIFDAQGNMLGNLAPIDGSMGPLTNVGDFDYTRTTEVSDYPVEGGSFATYNKVQLPDEPIVTLMFTGTMSQRTQFLNAIDAATKSINMYSVVTPEVVYLNHTIVSYKYSRSADKGATLLKVEITLKEVRQVQAQYTTFNPIVDPVNPTASATISSGTVQPQAVSPALVTGWLAA